MFRKVVLTLAVLTVVSAQIPSLGWCPEYVPMANFDMSRFLGVWYEAERYFQLSEVVSRCVMANYTLGPDGKFRVSNEVTNRFTGIKRVLEGEIKPPTTKADEGKLFVKYTTIPLTPETKYSVLETDYDNYAVLWSCSGIGPLHAQNAWLMTRERFPPGEVLQKAYGVLDKYKISKVFFVKTDQEDCAYLAANPPKEEKPGQAESSSDGAVRSAIVPDAPKIIIETKKAEKMAEQQSSAQKTPNKEAEKVEEPAPVETVPERILKVAETVKEEEIPVAVEEDKVDEKVPVKKEESTA